MGGIRKLMVTVGAGAYFALGGASVHATQTPKYTNAEVVAIKAQERLLVVRNNDGQVQTLELDDRVAGFGDLRPGDRVLLTLRGEPGRARIEAFSKAQSPPARQTPAETSPGKVVTSLTNGEAARVEETLEQRVATLAEQASRVDILWNGFRESCNVTLRGGAYGDAREWLSLWDQEAQVDLSSGACRGLYNQIVGLGQHVNAGVAAAEEAARRTLEPGQIREILRRHSLDWAGWGRNAPDLQDPR